MLEGLYLMDGRYQTFIKAQGYILSSVVFYSILLIYAYLCNLYATTPDGIYNYYLTTVTPYYLTTLYSLHS